MDELEKAFASTTSVLLGKPLAGLSGYAPWLLKHIKGRVIERKSVVSGKPVYVCSVDFFSGLGDNVVTEEESIEVGKERKLEESRLDCLSVENAAKLLSGISTTTPEAAIYKNVGTKECTCYGPSHYCFQSTFCWFAKLNAYGYWTKKSESVFGCANIMGCKFCIDCYGSTKLSRCFEVTDSNSCNDCYFCHNVENMSECMFCFNTKAKRYAIANVEIGREKYMRIKKRVLAQIHSELEETKELKYDIYSLGLPA